MPIPPFPKALRESHPNLEEHFWPYLHILNQESPRGKVLISTGLLEEQLKEMLRAFMIAGTVADDLFEGGSPPFATFSSRIAGCYALGLINEEEFIDLNLIRKMRNDFAHRIDTSFETPSVRDRCRELKTRIPSEILAAGVIARPEAETQFTTSAVNLILRFVNRPEYVSRERRTPKEWPY